MYQCFKRWTALLLTAVLIYTLPGMTAFAEEPEHETETYESSAGDTLRMINGFGALESKTIYADEKLPLAELGLPSEIPVYMDNSGEAEVIGVTWQCSDDYEQTDYDAYTFTPQWDGARYGMDAAIDKSSIPVIEVYILKANKAVFRDSSVTIPAESDYEVTAAGALKGLKSTYLSGLTAEEKQNIQLVIPYAVGGVTVQSIDESAFSFWYNHKYDGCNFISLDLTKATALKSIGKSAFYNVKGIGGSLSIPDSVESIGDNAFRDCTGLTGGLKLPASLKQIGEYAFLNCPFTGTLTLPESLESIGSKHRRPASQGRLLYRRM